MEQQEGTGRQGERSRRDRFTEVLGPYILCLAANFCFAGFNIVSKVSLDKGISRYVLVAYGHALGTVATAVLALLYERDNAKRISMSILRDILFLGLLGAVLGRTLYYAGLEYTSSTFASAMSNLIPSFTFLSAVLCRMERVDISRRGTQAMVVGTVVACGGATLMTLYKGIVVISPHTQGSHQTVLSSKVMLDKTWLKGSFMLIISNLSLSVFYVLQTATINKYPAPITLTSLTCLSGAILSTIMAAILDHKPSSWRLSWDITLLAPVYSGIVIYGITYYIQILVSRRKGPVFMTAFRPLCTIIVAIIGLLIFGESLHLGSTVGATLIVFGLYAVLWGKENEKEEKLTEGTIHEEAAEIKL